MIKSLILTGFGINCEIEMGAAYKNAGAEVTIIHFNELMNGTYNLHDFDILNFPGGFSFGDDIASGKVMSNKVKYKKMQSGLTFIQEIEKFIKNGKHILGICNGFQILVQLGLLPNIKNDFEPETALVQNNSNKYEDRWVYCKVNPNVKTPFLKGINLLPVPVRHGEGKLVIKDDATRKQILDNNLIALSYADKDGNITDEYPKNPNGAEFSIAGLTDPTGQIFGLMPHPEAYLSFYNNPSWAKLKRESKEIERENTGQVIFDNIVKHIGR
ncbi:MAG: phosphoribosylformylglycinamidine synthase subunit PurQ [Chlorobi bacterium]|nr:phosphoribosylformylglycinamidine synthase subunit PurQ [Chlorobiota bacterium]